MIFNLNYLLGDHRSGKRIESQHENKIKIMEYSA